MFISFHSTFSRLWQRFSRNIIVITIVLLPAVASADQYDDQINALRGQINQQQTQASQLSAQADTLANKLAQLNAQTSSLQAQIQVNRLKYRQGQAKIADFESQLAEQKSVLAVSLKSMYVDSSITPIEMIASSNNLSDYFNQQTYQDSIKDKIQSSMTEVVKLKADLETQQKDVATLLSQQQGMKDSLALQQAATNQLLADTQGQEATYESQTKDSKAKIAQLEAQQAAAIAAASRRVNYQPSGAAGKSSGGGGACDIGQGNGGYPVVWCNAAQDSLTDSWGMFNRECVSYAAWAASVRFGKYVPYWGGRGNAKQWPDNARAAGIPVNSSPRVGDVAIYMGGAYGHAMIVEEVKGSSVIVSSMNGDLQGHFRYDEWPVASLQFIHF